MQRNNVLITTSKDAKSQKTLSLASELALCIPDSVYKSSTHPHNIRIKIIEHHNRPLFISITRDQYTLEFKIIEYKSLKDLRNKADPASHMAPELVVSNFNSEYGHAIVNMLIDIFPQENVGNRVVCFNASSDFIIFRMYRYRFGDATKVEMQDIGPHVTLRLRRIINDDKVEVIDYRRHDHNNGNVTL
ncbi:Ribosome production factor 1 [Conglomerata obtusa]